MAAAARASRGRAAERGPSAAVAAAAARARRARPRGAAAPPPAALGRRAAAAALAALAAAGTPPRSARADGGDEASTSAPAAGDGEESSRFEQYDDTTNGFSLLVPAEGWSPQDKPGSTFYTTDGSLFGSNSVGVTVNPVKVDSLSSFGGVDDVWVKLRAAEVAKESTKSIDLVDSGKRAPSDGAAELFTYEYVLDSTRGKKHVFNAVAITGSKLYILNAQCKDKGTEETDALAADLGMVLKSFTVTAAA